MRIFSATSASQRRRPSRSGRRDTSGSRAAELARARRRWLTESLPRNARRSVDLPVGPGAEALASVQRLWTGDSRGDAPLHGDAA